MTTRLLVISGFVVDMANTAVHACVFSKQVNNLWLVLASSIAVPILYGIFSSILYTTHMTSEVLPVDSK